MKPDVMNEAELLCGSDFNDRLHCGQILKSHIITRMEPSAVPLEDMIEEQLKAIYQHHRILSQHHLILSQLRIRLNSRAPINARLPTELLIQIFKAYEEMCRPKHNLSRMEKRWARPYGWSVVSLICHYWRDIALATPSLWTFIQAGAPLEQIETWLSRSKSLPLQAVVHTINLEHDGVAEGTTLLFQHFARMKILDVALDDIDYVKTTFPPSTIPATALRYVRIHNLATRIEKDEVIQCILGRQLPCLTAVELLGSPWKWVTLELPQTLTSLVIGFTVTSQHCSPAEVLEVLRRLPLLVTLELEGKYIGNARDDQPFIHGLKPDVELFNLQTLFITGPISRCLAYLQHIRFPVQTRIHLETSIIQERHSLHLPLLDVLASKLSHGQPLLELSLSLTAPQLHWGVYDFTLELSGWPSIHPPSELFNNETPRVLVIFKSTNESELVTETLEGLGRSISAVETLRITEAGAYPLDLMKLGSMPNVRYLSLFGHDGLAQLPDLLITTSPDGRNPIFSNLRELEVYLQCTRCSSPPSYDYWAKLVHGLKLRRDWGLGLERLIIGKDAGVCKHEVDDAASFIDEVVQLS
ncbi:unnamed protein product [Somion occarium]|uniref:F-box domain-containing protein n=1 Tax=Somion occarium TaxID=3059160 RepID=A0ABP1E1X3_9APHY